MRILNREILYDSNFRMYLLTRKSIPSFAPSIYSLVAVIDFGITEDALEAELLDVTMNVLLPNDETRRILNINNRRSTNDKLQTMEQSLLGVIASTDGPLLENSEIIDRVENIKLTIAALKNTLNDIVQCVATIEAERQNYRLLVKRAATLFITLTEMAHVNVFYQYSLTAFIELFLDTMREFVDNDRDVADGQSQIYSELKKRSYESGSIGMIGRDRILFALQMAIKCEICDGRLEQKHVDFFYDSPTAIQLSASPVRWLTAKQWNSFVAFDKKFTSTGGIAQHIQANEMDWQRWYSFENPESVDIPGGYFRSDHFMVMNDDWISIHAIESIRPSSTCIFFFIFNFINST